VKEGFSPDELEIFKVVLRSFFDKFDKQEGRT